MRIFVRVADCGADCGAIASGELSLTNSPTAPTAQKSRVKALETTTYRDTRGLSVDVETCQRSWSIYFVDSRITEYLFFTIKNYGVVFTSCRGSHEDCRIKK